MSIEIVIICAAEGQLISVQCVYFIGGCTNIRIQNLFLLNKVGNL